MLYEENSRVGKAQAWGLVRFPPWNKYTVYNSLVICSFCTDFPDDFVWYGLCVYCVLSVYNARTATYFKIRTRFEFVSTSSLNFCFTVEMDRVLGMRRREIETGEIQKKQNYGPVLKLNVFFALHSIEFVCRPSNLSWGINLKRCFVVI